MKKSTKLALALLALAALAVGGFLFYFYVIREDAPPELTTSDLDNALGTTPAATTPAASTPAGVEASDPSGVWTISTDSILGYRVQEVLGGLDTEGAGRTNQVTGSLTIEGTTLTEAAFTVDMATFSSDDSRRDGKFRGPIMSVDEFPTSTFVLTSPIDFGTVPVAGESLTATASGDLTLRGVTRSVTFDVQAKLDNGRLGVLGNIPILFSDYEINDPSNGFAEVKDNGLLEFVLVFDQA